MKIAIIGTGNVGSVLGQRWAELGHTVVFGSRRAESEEVQALEAQSNVVWISQTYKQGWGPDFGFAVLRR